MMGQLRTSPTFLLTVGAALVIIVGATLAGWLATTRLEPNIAENRDAALLSAAFGVARHSSLLASVGSVPTVSSMSPDRLAERSDRLAAEETALRQQLVHFEAHDDEEHVETIRQHIDSLAYNIELIEAARPELLSLMSESLANYRKIRFELKKKLDAALVTSLDDQFHYLVAGYNGTAPLSGSAADRLSLDDIWQYHHIFNLVESQRLGMGVLLGASVSLFPQNAQLIREDYHGAAQRMATSVKYLDNNTPATLQPDAIPLAREVLDLGGEEGSVWQTLDVKLDMIVEERRLIAANDVLLEELLHEVDLLVDDVNRRSSANTASATQALSMWRVLILAIGVTGVLGTLAAAAYFGTRASRQ